MPVSLNANTHNPERGSTLLVVAAVAILASVLMSLGIGAFKREEPVDLRFETLARQEFAMDQLAAYVHRNGDLPCPADPAETPGDTDFGTERAACTTTPNATGILPFRSLHLDDDAARDAWGRYFTYAISPVFANATDNNVFYRCRSERWVNDLGTIPADRNENAAKARFCCPPALLRTEDLVILDAANNAREAAPTFSERTADGAPAYGDINTVDLIGAPNTNATAFAVALVSHGSNGNGAFAGNGTTDRLDSTGVSAAEDENANGDNIYVDRPMVMEEGNNYYDDIVMTRTQTSLYSELNNASCFRPWR